MSKTRQNAHRLTAERNLEAILDATERLLTRQLEPSIAAVAAEAGVSRPTVYAHFPKRPDLIEALVARTVKRVTDAILESDPVDGTPPEALSRLLTASWEQLARHQDIARAAAAELGGEGMHRAHHAAHAAIASLIERGQAAGYWRSDLSPTWLATSLLSLIHAAADEVRANHVSTEAALAQLQRTTSALLD